MFVYVLKLLWTFRENSTLILTVIQTSKIERINKQKPNTSSQVDLWFRD